MPYSCVRVSKGTKLFEVNATQVTNKNSRSEKSTGKFGKKKIISVYHSIPDISGILLKFSRASVFG